MLYNKEKTVTVITVTRKRPDLLERAIQSVLGQQPEGFFIHYILIDDCPDTLQFLESTYTDHPIVTWDYYCRAEEDKSGPALLARLRNKAIQNTKTEWFSFLDDDNEYRMEHLISLLEFANTHNCNAVHSHYELLHKDGSPYLTPLYPWGRTPEKAKKLYDEMCDKGIMTPGSNIIRDRYGVVVDTNLWLIRRKIFNECSIPENYDERDWKRNITEDMKLMYILQENNVEALCNNQVTVKYYLGGYSNVFDGSVDGTETWEKISANDNED